jgi:hypothetical protein
MSKVTFQHWQLLIHKFSELSKYLTCSSSSVRIIYFSQTKNNELVEEVKVLTWEQTVKKKLKDELIF